MLANLPPFEELSTGVLSAAQAGLRSRAQAVLFQLPAVTALRYRTVRVFAPERCVSVVDGLLIGKFKQRLVHHVIELIGSVLQRSILQDWCNVENRVH